MFYTPRVLFIHVPRAGGDWLTQWAAETFRPDMLSIDTGYLKHSCHSGLIRQIPELVDHISLAICRNEDERFTSYLKLATEWKPHDTIPNNTTARGWLPVAEAARKLSVDEFRRHWFPSFRSYLARDTLVFPYERDMPLLTKWLVDVHHDMLRQDR